MLQTELEKLCYDYIWCVLTSNDTQGFSITLNAERSRIHKEIAKLLNIKNPHVGYLRGALHTLEGSAKLPDNTSNKKRWSSIAQQCSKKLAYNLSRIYVNGWYVPKNSTEKHFYCSGKALCDSSLMAAYLPSNKPLEGSSKCIVCSKILETEQRYKR